MLPAQDVALDVLFDTRPTPHLVPQEARRPMLEVLLAALGGCGGDSGVGTAAAGAGAGAAGNGADARADDYGAGAGAAAAAETAAAAAAAAGPRLRSLALGWGSEARAIHDILCRPNLQLSAKGLATLARHAPTLTHLDLAGALIHAPVNFFNPAGGVAAAAAAGGGGGPFGALGLPAGGDNPAGSLLGPLTNLTSLNMSNTALAMSPMLAGRIVGMEAWRPAALEGLNLRWEGLLEADVCVRVCFKGRARPVTPCHAAA